MSDPSHEQDLSGAENVLLHIMDSAAKQSKTGFVQNTLPMMSHQDTLRHKVLYWPLRIT